MYKFSLCAEKIIRLAVVDDHAMFRESLTKMLNGMPNLQVVILASDGIDLENQLYQESVDVILLDINMPRQNGILTCKRILKLFPKSKIIGLSAFTDSEVVLRMIESGACGFFSKNANVDDLLKGIFEVNTGGYYFDSSLSKILSLGVQNRKNVGMSDSDLITEFTNTELEVLKLVCEQQTNKEIAKTLRLSERTVETHRRNLIEKSQSKNMIGVVIYAFQQGLVDFTNYNPSALQQNFRDSRIA